MVSLQLPKFPMICALAIALAAEGSDGSIQPQQSCCSHGLTNRASNKPKYSISTPSSGLLMNSFLRDPWSKYRDLWHDPFSWGHHFPWSSSYHPWGLSLSLLSPSLSTGRNDVLPSWLSRPGYRCHSHTAENEQSRLVDEAQSSNQQESNLRQWGDDPKCCKEGTDNEKMTQLRQDEIQREREQYQRQMEQQRLQRDSRRRMLEEEEAELNRRHNERRLKEEERRMEQQRQEEVERQRWHREEEEQRWKEERLRRQREQELEERRTKLEQERRRRQQEQAAATDERRHREAKRSHPSQGVNNDRYHHGNLNNNQRQQFKKTQITSLQIPGYVPEDVSIKTSGNKLMVQGKHVCHCNEKCTEREFQRSFAIPSNTDRGSLEAKLTKDGLLTISGNQHTSHVHSTKDFVVAVEGDGSFTPQSRNTDATCGGTKTGFKLKKMNKRTGEIVEDYEELLRAMDARTFEEEVDDDGITLEVED